MIRLILAILVGVFINISFGANIVESAGGGNCLDVEKVTVSRTIDKFYNGQSTETMTFNFFRYGEVRQDMPLVVVFISWGGTVDGARGSVSI